jgi:hypothetical protein
MSAPERSNRTEWDIQDAVEDAVRDSLPNEVPYYVDVREQASGYRAVILLKERPSGRLRECARNLEAKLSAEGHDVEVAFERGDPKSASRPSFAKAREAFEQVWGRLERPPPAPADEKTSLKPSVRDFIYLDVERLASLFAQSRKGLTTLVALHERGLQAGTTSAVDAEEAVSTEAEKVRGEISVLHDYMYNLVESELNPFVFQAGPGKVVDASHMDSLRKSYMCSVSGIAAIHDYKRLSTFLSRFNELGEAIAYTQLKTPEVEAAIAALQEDRSDAHGKQKQEIAERLRKLGDVKTFARERGLYHDEELLKKLRFFIDLFCGDAFEVQIRPSTETDSLVFRAYLKRESLRMPTDKLRMLFGSPTQEPWVLVGSVTSISLPTDNNSPSPPPPEGAKKGVRQFFDVMIQMMNFMESETISKSAMREVVLYPLAIYRDLRR